MAEEIIDPRQLLAEMGAILEKLKIDYAVTGGMAIYVWGRPRFTSDIDIIIELAPTQADALVAVLKLLYKAGYVERDAVERAMRRNGEFNFIDGRTGVNKSGFSKAQLSRRVKRVVRKQKVYFVSAEDLILSKLLWHRESESSKQLQDVESIVKIQKKLDWKYLRKWAKIQSTFEILNSLKMKK